MKKRLLSTLFVILMLFSCLCVSVSADSYCDISLFDDFKTLRYGSVLYYRFDSTDVIYDYSNSFEGVEYNIDNVKYVDYDISKNNTIIDAHIYFNDGSSLSASFIDELSYSEYNKICDTPNECLINFDYMGDNIYTDWNSLTQNRMQLSYDMFYFCESFDTLAVSSNGSFSVKKGSLLIIDDEYYYIDYKHAGISSDYDFASNSTENLWGYKITDGELIKKLDKSYNQYSGLSFSFLGGNLSKIAGTIILIFIFGLVPLAAFVLFLILTLKAKNQSYKKIFKTIYILSGIELIIFAAITIIILIYN